MIDLATMIFKPCTCSPSFILGFPVENATRHPGGDGEAKPYHLVLRSGVDLTLTTSDAVTTSQHIPNACILWVKDTKENTFVYSITDADKRKIYEQSMYGDQKATQVFGNAAPIGEAQKEEAPAGTPR